MNASIFSDILKKVNHGEIATLSINDHDGLKERVFVPKERLLILGAGHVAMPLCKIASMLDFSVTVIDDRPAFASRTRFEDAESVICDAFDHAIDQLRIRPNDYICVVTRGHRWDNLCVRKLLSHEKMPFFFGMISSHRRAAGMKEQLLEEGFEKERVDALCSPIGLEIGALTTSEIAVSITAQLIEKRRSLTSASGENALLQTNADVKMLEFLAQSRDPRAMMLVLSSSGSTPVKSGAMMAIDSLSNAFGTIGGGCSEAAAMVKARRLIGTGKRQIVEVDMTDDVAAENGMVCGGSMRVLIEDITNDQ